VAMFIIQSGSLFTKRRKNIAPNIELCGTQLRTLSHCEKNPPTPTFIMQPVMLNQQSYISRLGFIRFPAAQKAWDIPLLIVHEAKVLLSAPDLAGKAYLIADMAPHTGTFLNGHPCGCGPLCTRFDPTLLINWASLNDKPFSCCCSCTQLSMLIILSCHW